MKDIIETIIGIVMTVVGAFLFMENITVNGTYSGFFQMGAHGMFHVGASTLGVLVICMAIALFAVVVLPNRLTKSILIALFVLFIVAMILSLRFEFKRISGASLFLILGMLVVGVALIVKNVLGMKKNMK